MRRIYVRCKEFAELDNLKVRGLVNIGFHGPLITLAIQDIVKTITHNTLESVNLLVAIAWRLSQKKASAIKTGRDPNLHLWICCMYNMHMLQLAGTRGEN